MVLSIESESTEENICVNELSDGITVVYRYTVKSGIHVTKRYRKKKEIF